MPAKRFFFILTPTGRRYIGVMLTALIITLLLNMFFHVVSAINPMEGKYILIDPGHGGIDGGTGDGGGLLEKEVNLQIALKLRELLESLNARVDMTRESDISLDDRNNLSSSRHNRDLIARTELINNGKYDLFVSIHVNRATNRSAAGPLVLYSARIPQTQFLAELIQESMNTLASRSLGKKILHRPVKSDAFILRNSKIPGVLVETGFMSNPAEKSLLADKAYQEKVAQAIVQGIRKYFASEREWKKELP